MDTPSEQRLSDLETRVAKLEKVLLFSSEMPRDVSTQKKLSAREFLMAKPVKTELHKTIALAYYLERIEGMMSFNVSDLASAFRSAKEARPKNLSDTIGKNVARGLLMPVPELKDKKMAWELTSTGEKYVEEELKS